MVRSSITKVGCAVVLVVLASGCSGDEGPTEPSAELASLEVTPTTQTAAALGEARGFEATPRDRDGEPLGETEISWSIEPDSVGLLEPNGHEATVTAETPGDAEVTAQASGEEASASFVVSQEVAEMRVSPDSAAVSTGGSTSVFEVEIVDANDHALEDADPSWTVDPDTVASLEPNGHEATVTSQNPGSAQVLVEASGEEASANLVVYQEVTEVSVSPDSASILDGDTVRFDAEPVDSDGRPVQGAEITWSSSDETVATVTDDGAAVGHRDGRITIQAEVAGMTDGAGLRVHEFEVVQWLRDRPELTEVIRWPLAYNEQLEYEDWSMDRLKDLEAFWHSAHDDHPFDVERVPTANLAEEDLTSDDRPRTVLDEDDAWDLYLAHLAHSLWVEHNERVPWSLSDLPEDERRVILDGSSLFLWTNDPEGYYMEPRGIPTEPTHAWEFLRDEGILGGSQEETIIELLEWSRDHLAHYWGSWSAGNTEHHWDYRGGAPVARVIEGTTINLPVSNQRRFAHWTAGCRGTTHLYQALLRVANIPVFRERPGSHEAPHFPTINAYMSHGDDPYSQPIASQVPETGGHRVPAREILIDPGTFEDWFGSHRSRSEANAYVSQQIRELALEYLSDWLLGRYCDDLQVGRSKEEGMVNEFFIHRSVSDLQEKGLWARMDARLESYGGCGMF